MPLELHKDGEGHVVVSDEGFPMIVKEEGATPESFDIGGAITRISGHGAEKQKLLDQRDGAQKNLKPWETLGKSVEEVSEAFTRLDSLTEEQQELTEAVATADKAGYERGTSEHKDKLKAGQERITALESERFQDRVRNCLLGSKVAASRLVESHRHIDEVEHLIGDFAREDDEGRIYFVDRKGVRIVSEEKDTLGDPAGREESILHLLKTHPRADIIMCADVGGGGGTEDGDKGTQGPYTISRAARRADTTTMQDVRRIKEAAEKAGEKVKYIA